MEEKKPQQNQRPGMICTQAAAELLLKKLPNAGSLFNIIVTSPRKAMIIEGNNIAKL